MELRHLRYFVAVAEELHFGHAAEHLHISQPPLSKQIRRLEAELGVELFWRNRRRVELTRAGRLLLANALPLLSEADRIQTLMRRAGQGMVGQLGVGFVGSASYEALPQILRAFRDRYPDVELNLDEQTTADQVELLREGRIDVGLVRPPVTDKSIKLTPLVTEQLIAALPDSHPLAARKSIAVSELSGEPFVCLPRRLRASLYDDMFSVCRQAGFTPNVVQEAEEMQTIISLVSAGIGVSLAPAAVETFQRPHVVYRPLRGPNANLELALAQRSIDHSMLVQQFRDVAQAATRRERQPTATGAVRAAG
jgi:DNA-binding transcriptional LysR family regulator